MYGWTLDYALNMPAIQFFLMLKYGRDREHRKKNLFFYELCFVAGSSAYTSESRKDLAGYYYNAAYGKYDKLDSRGRKVLNAADPRSAQIAAALMGQKNG